MPRAATSVATRKRSVPLPHPLHHLLARCLGQVGGQLIGVIAKALQHHGHVIHPHLGVAEDQGRRRVLHLDDAHQAAVLIHAVHRVKDVLDLGHVDVVAAQVQKARLAAGTGRPAG